MNTQGRIDKKTEAIARVMANRAGQAADYPWAIEGGGFAPAWVMYVSAATELTKMIDAFDEIKKLKL